MGLTDMPVVGDTAIVYTEAGQVETTVHSVGDNTVLLFHGEEAEQNAIRDEDNVWRTAESGHMVVFTPTSKTQPVVTAVRQPQVGDYTFRTSKSGPEIWRVTRVFDASTVITEPESLPTEFWADGDNVISKVHGTYQWPNGEAAYFTDGDRTSLLTAASRCTAVYVATREKYFHYETQAYKTQNTPAATTTMRAIADELADLLYLLETGLNIQRVDQDVADDYRLRLHEEFKATLGH